MASKRKSTTPCMIPVKTLVLQETEQDAGEDDHEGTQPEAPAEGPAASDAGASNSNNGALSNGHRGIADGDTFICKPCDFGSHDLHQFFGHLDSEHSDFGKDPAFACVGCSFLANSHEGLSHHNTEVHAGETSFVWRLVKQDGRTTVEQSLEATSSHDLPGEVPEEGADGQSEIIITKTPIMKIMKGKPEAKKIHTLKENVSSQLGGESEVKDGEHSFPNGSVPVSQPTASSTKSSHIVNGSIIGNVPVLQAGVAQLVSLQQQPPLHQQLPTSKSLPKVMIPLSSIPTYNAAMDSNSFLKNSFNKFPYPTKAELCYLTVVTKYPEEQLKIWFTAQRLKQGISWSPEEIEDARKKMFNTVIQSVPQPTITVLNTPLVANPGTVPHLIQATLPGHVVGQPEGTGGLLVTQPIMANGLKGTSSSFTLAVTSVPKPQPAGQHSTVSSSNTSGVKVVNSAQSLLTACPAISSQTFLDPNVYKNKKSHEQLSALKGSFCRNQFPGQAEVERLTKITGLSTKEIRKWFSDRRYHYRNVRGGRAVFPGDSALDSLPEMSFDVPARGAELSPAAAVAATPAPQHPARRQAWHQAPDFTPTKYKERAPEQLKALESSFAQNPLPAEEEVNRLRGETKMTRREIDSWFSERRKKKVAEENKKVEEVAQQEEEEAENGGGEGEDSSDEQRAASENGSVDASGINPNSAERKVSPIKINLKNLRVTESNGKNEVPGTGANEKGDGSSSRPPTPPKTKLNFKKTAQQRHLLKQMFVQTQRPTNQEYDAIVSQTGLPRAEVIRWFGDSRYGYKNGQLKWYENYRRGVFPPGLVEVGPAGREVLEDYYETHKGLREEDVPGLCERARLGAQQLKVWFAVKAEEQGRGCGPEAAGSRKGPCEAGAEASESSEAWEPGGQQGSAGTPDAPGPPPATGLGKARASAGGLGWQGAGPLLLRRQLRQRVSVRG